MSAGELEQKVDLNLVTEKLHQRHYETIICLQGLYRKLYIFKAVCERFKIHEKKQ